MRWSGVVKVGDGSNSKTAYPTTLQGPTKPMVNHVSSFPDSYVGSEQKASKSCTICFKALVKKDTGMLVGFRNESVDISSFVFLLRAPCKRTNYVK
eukprot:2291323-Amphidinium_carterae.1